VHIFTSGDAAELFLNGRSLGKKQKQPFEYRLRWDDVSYEPGELKVVSYKNGKIWAEQTVHTTDTAAQLYLTADRTPIQADGKDLCFVTIRVADKNGLTVPVANNSIRVTVAGVGELVATDNGNPADMVSFGSHKRDAYFGLALAIIRSKVGKAGVIKVTVESPGLSPAVLELYSK
jgi:beta-galactosidase